MAIVKRMDTAAERKTVEEPSNVEELKEQLAFRESLLEITNQIHAAKNINEILIDLKDRILSLLKADRITIYVVDGVKREIYSRFKEGDEVSEIRVPISASSISGYVALSGRLVNIIDSYDKEELAEIHDELMFDHTWDERTGYKTTQQLVLPIKFDRYTLGVIQLINKIDADSFTEEDEEAAREISNTLGIAFYNQHKMHRRKPSKFDYLLTNHIITEKELERAVTESRETRRDPVEVLMRNYGVSAKQIGASLGEFYDCQYLEFDDRRPIPGELLHNLKETFLKNNLWVPLENVDGRVTILMDDPANLTKRDMVRRLVRADKYEYSVGLPETILKYIEFFFGGGIMEDGMDLDALLMAEGDFFTMPEDEEFAVTESDAAIVRIVNQILIEGYKRGASDIHFEPYPGLKNMDVRFRVDGACRLFQTVPASYKRALVSRIKIMADLDIAEKRLPQDGKIKFKKFGGPDIELRIATLPTQGALEDVVIRILASGEPLPLDVMGFSERDYEEFIDAIIKPYGICLVVGPTGSGKTTTLHAALKYINTPDRKIWTAEDPVEITQVGLRQVQVRHKIGLSFANALRAFLRADPDVIMVGEMRDEETAAMGIEASLTGHLVFSTLHTNSAPETVTRLLDMGLDPFNFADAVLVILAQRLGRTLCKDCKESYHPDREEFDLLVEEYGPEDFPRLSLEFSSDLTLYRANGCNKCGDTGYRGRTGLFEVLTGTDEMKRLIQRRAPIDDIRQQAIDDGMSTLKQDGIRKVFEGLMDVGKVRAVCIK